MMLVNLILQVIFNMAGGHNDGLSHQEHEQTFKQGHHQYQERKNQKIEGDGGRDSFALSKCGCELEPTYLSPCGIKRVTDQFGGNDTENV